MRNSGVGAGSGLATTQKGFFIDYDSAMNRSTKTAGISLLVLAFLPYAYVNHRLHSHNWAPLEAAANIESNSQFVSTTFVPDLSGTYEVSLAFAPINIPAEECLVGDSLFKGSCRSTPAGLDLDWSVLKESGGKEVVASEYRSYRPYGFEGAGSVETVLGRFDADKNSNYKIALRVRNIAPELKSASPKVRVEAARFYWEDWVIYSQMSFVFALFLASMGIATLGWEYFSDRQASN